MLTDAHCHPADLARLFPGAEGERRRLGIACASSSSTLEEFEFCEGLAREALAAGAAPLLPCFAAHPQLPLRIAQRGALGAGAGGGHGEACGGAGGGALGGGLGESLDALRMLAREGRLAAVGETGFDLFGAAFRETEKAQDALFGAHVEAALRHGLPVVIHARRAMHKIFANAAALRKCRAVVFHSWPGLLGEGEALLRRGVNAFFSFGAIVALSHREAMRCCALFPADRLLAETDAPYQPLRRAERGFSSHSDLPLVLKAMAALRREAGSECASAGELEKAAEANFRAAFGL